VIYLCATKGRPESIRELISSMYLYGMADVAVMVGLPHSDYASVRWPKNWKVHHATENGGLTQAINSLAAMYLDHDYLGVLNDRARIRQSGWLERLVEAAGDGYANPHPLSFNPRTNRPRLKNGVFNAKLIREWGWMFPPWLTHLYVDDVLEDILYDAGKFYQTDVLIEEQPIAKHAREVNGEPFAERDRKAYVEWAQARC
jgi:hypothetical protein